MPAWLRTFVDEQWAPEEDALVAMSWRWRTEDGQQFDLLEREVCLRGSSGPLAMAHVTPGTKWAASDSCAGVSAVELVLDNDARVRFMLQRNFAGDLRLRGHILRPGAAEPEAFVASRTSEE